MSSFVVVRPHNRCVNLYVRLGTGNIGMFGHGNASCFPRRRRFLLSVRTRNFGTDFRYNFRGTGGRVRGCLRLGWASKQDCGARGGWGRDGDDEARLQIIGFQRRKYEESGASVRPREAGYEEFG